MSVPAKLSVFAFLLLAGCERPVVRDATAQPSALRLVPVANVQQLRETSGLVTSRRQPGVLFAIDDSGNEPVLYAFDTTGGDRGAWGVENAKNTDWESLGIAPCAAASTDTCLYIGDTGDNNGARASRTIYRVREPDAVGARDTVHATALRYAYADGPHDVEAMYVAPNGDVLLVTKRALRDASRRLRPALVFAIPARAWGDSSRATAMLVDSLPIVPGSQPLMVVTDASLSADAKHLAVRTYAQAYVFATDSATGRVNHAVPPRLCDLTALGEPQGEGLSWLTNDGRIAFTSEGQRQPLRLATCAMPRGAG
jgi:hypothetical protein